MKYLILIHNKFEEIEGLAQVDIFARAKIPIDMYGIDDDVIVGRSGITVQTPFVFKKVGDIDVAGYDGLLIPGGPGIDTLMNNEEVINLIKAFQGSAKLIFAICAAPKLLDKAGILNGKRFTCFPGAVSEIKSGTHINERVVIDKNIITSQSAGTAIEAALKLVEIIVSKDVSQTIAKAIVF